MTSMVAVCTSHFFGWGPVWWPLFPLLWLGVFLLVGRFFWRGRRGGGPGARASADSVLAERYARGEIGEDEYRERLEVLKGRS